MSVVEHKIENILLKERQNLINSGTISKHIQIRGNGVYVNHKLYAAVQSSQLCVLSANPQPVNIVPSAGTSNAPNHSLVANSYPPQTSSPIDESTGLDISVCIWNACSLVNKLKNFTSFVLSQSFQIIAITETWLSDFIYNHEILPSSYSIYHRDHTTRGGGVLIAVNQSIPSRIINVAENI